MTEREIFAAAREKAGPTARGVYLDAVCAGDPALRARVDRLLLAAEQPDSLLDVPAVGVPDRGMRTTAPGASAPDRATDGFPFLTPPTRPGTLGRLAHYEIQEVLGRGGFGTVFKAFDDRLHRVVAIKVMAPQLAASATARARFLREGRAGAAVRDEHVVSIHFVSGDDDPHPFLVMEYVAGQTLQQKLDRAGPLPAREVLRIGHQIARGLAAAHATGVIHRDIKPANILLENGVERVKITDFGLARTADDASLSHSGAIAGTPQYMAPEQACGEPLDHRADLFSFGSVLYAMCTGRPPFRASTVLAVLKRLIEDAPRPIRDVNSEVPGWLADVVARLHAKAPAGRFQSAREVADLLARYLADLQLRGTVTAPPAARPGAGPTRRRVAVVAGLVTLAALGGVGAFALTRSGLERGGDGRATTAGGPDRLDRPGTDLVPLARPNPAFGTWAHDRDRLVCSPRPGNDQTFQILPIPVDLPDEYEFEAVFERLSGADMIGFNLTGAGASFCVMVDGWPGFGSWSGLSPVDKKEPYENGAGLRGPRIVNGKRQVFRCTVRAAGVVATLDDQPLVDYAGPFARIDGGYLAYQGTKVYVKVLGTDSFRLHRLRLIPLPAVPG